MPFAGPSSVLCFLSFLLLFLKLFLLTLLEVFFPKPSSTGTPAAASFFLNPCCLLFPKLLPVFSSLEKSLFLSFLLFLSFEPWKFLLSFPAKFLFLSLFPAPSLPFEFLSFLKFPFWSLSLLKGFLSLFCGRESFSFFEDISYRLSTFLSLFSGFHLRIYISRFSRLCTL